MIDSVLLPNAKELIQRIDDRKILRQYQVKINDEIWESNII